MGDDRTAAGPVAARPGQDSATDTPSPTSMQWGIRARLALTAAASVFVAMLVGGAGLILLLEDNLESSTRQDAATRASAVADVISSEGLSEATETVVSSPRGGSIVQIVSPDGSVFSSSSGRHTAAPLVGFSPASGKTQTEDLASLDGEEGEWAVAARGVSVRGQTFVVQVGVPIEIGRDVVRTVVRSLMVATPLLLGAVALIVWVLIGRALGAVEALRRTVAQIDGQRLSTRVEVPQTRDEVAALAVTMNAMLDRLEKSDRAQRTFVSDASHELRSPLATLSAAAELAESATEPRRSRLLATVRTETVRLRALVEDLMAMARAEAPRPGPVVEVDLDEVVDAEARRLRMTTSLQIVTVGGPARVWADRGSVGRAVRNIVDNASRHARTAVRMDLAVDAHEARLWIDNDGPVIDPADRERVFERFVRLDESRSRDAGGSGLGLAIARGIVRSHHGVLRVVDASDGWCRFEVRLPLADQHDIDDEALTD